MPPKQHRPLPVLFVHHRSELGGAPESLSYLIRELDRYDLTAVPRPDCLKLDTGVNPAEVTAQNIVGHFRLDVLP